MTEQTTFRCAECPNPLPAPKSRGGKPQVFCSAACKAAHKHRKHVRGQALISIAQGWRKTRSAGEFGKWLFNDMTAMLDQFNAEDRDAGRIDPVEYAKQLVRYTPVNPDYNGGRTFEADRFLDRLNRKGRA